MAYQQVTPGETITSSTGNFQLTLTSTKALLAGTRQAVRRTCARFAGNADRTPIVLESLSTSGNTARFLSTGTSLFGPTLADFNQPTPVVFTPLILDESDAVVFEGVSFTVTLERAIEQLLTDVPITNGVYRLWDTRNYLDLGLKTWYDKRYGDPILFPSDSNGDMLAFNAPASYTNLKFDGLQFTKPDLGGADLPAAGFMDVPLPPQWSICILGYTDLVYSSIVDNTRVYDAALGYAGSTIDGPFEGAYRYKTSGVVFGSPKISFAGDDVLRLSKCVVITSDTVEPVVESYLDGTPVGGAAFNTTTNGKLSTLFPRLDSMSFDFTVGQLVIYDRVLSPAEVATYANYAETVWYDVPA